MENTFGEKWTLNFLQSGQQQVCFVYDFIISFYKMLLINFIISLLILHTPAILYLSPKPFESQVYSPILKGHLFWEDPITFEETWVTYLRGSNKFLQLLWTLPQGVNESSFWTATLWRRPRVDTQTLGEG